MSQEQVLSNLPESIAGRVLKEAEENDTIYRTKSPRLDFSLLHYGNVRMLDWALEQFGQSVSGRRLLDVGIGEGHSSVLLAQRGAVVTGIDVSVEALERARALARHYGAALDLRQMAAEQLAFDDEVFDGILCMSAFHHTDLERASSEFARVLKPGCRAVLVEPLASNPPAWIYRKIVQSGSRGATSKESPLRIRDLDHMRRRFGRVDWRGMFLLTLAPIAADRVWNSKNPGGHRLARAVFNRLIRVDEALLSWPGVGRLAWKVCIIAHK